MANSSFGNGWPNCDRANIVTLVRADGLRIALHRDIVDLVQVCMDVTEALGYDILTGQTWGYACRAIAGTNRPSNHSWGTAVDVNSLHNPQRRPLLTDLPGGVVDFWQAQGFRWGGDYREPTRPDPMHFEYMDTASEAQLQAARLRAFFSALGGDTPPPATPPGRPAPRPYPGPVRLGGRGPAVKVWQQLLRDRGYSIAVDGVFGPSTNHVVWHWQSTHGLTGDGIAGPATWHSLLFA